VKAILDCIAAFVPDAMVTWFDRLAVHVSSCGVVYKLSPSMRSESALVIKGRGLWDSRRSIGSASIWEDVHSQIRSECSVRGWQYGDPPETRGFCLICMDSVASVRFKTEEHWLHREICKVVEESLGSPFPVFRGGMLFSDAVAWLTKLTYGQCKVPAMMMWLNVNEIIHAGKVQVPLN
jgi:hypothetical protein